MVETNWIDVLVDPAPLRAIYGEDLPTLKNIDLHEIILHRDGPAIVFRFDLAFLPKQMPKKWELGKFNRVQIQLAAFDIYDLSITGWKARCKIDVVVMRAEKIIRVSGRGDINFDLTADRLMIRKVSAYHDSE